MQQHFKENLAEQESFMATHVTYPLYRTLLRKCTQSLLARFTHGSAKAWDENWSDCMSKHGWGSERGSQAPVHGAQLLTSLWSSEARSLCSPLLLFISLCFLFTRGAVQEKSSGEEKKRAGSGSTNDIWSERQKGIKKRSREAVLRTGPRLLSNLVLISSQGMNCASLLQDFRSLSYWSGLSESSGGTLACKAVPQLVHERNTRSLPYRCV